MTLKVKTKHDDCEMILDVEKKDTREYSLPHGWKKVGQKRRSLSRFKAGNSTRGDWDFFIISPSGKRFRSTVEVNKYLDKNPHVKCDRNVTNTHRPVDLQSSTNNGKNIQMPKKTLPPLIDLEEDKKENVIPMKNIKKEDGIRKYFVPKKEKPSTVDKVIILTVNYYPEHYPPREKMLRIVIGHLFWRFEPK